MLVKSIWALWYRIFIIMKPRRVVLDKLVRNSNWTSYRARPYLIEISAGVINIDNLFLFFFNFFLSFKCLWTLWRQVGFFYIVLLTLHCPNLQPIHKSTNTCQSSLHTCSPNLLWTNEYHHRSPIGLCQQLIMVRFRVGAATHIQTQLVPNSVQSCQLLFSSLCVYVTFTEFIMFLCPLDLEGRWPQLAV